MVFVCVCLHARVCCVKYSEFQSFFFPSSSFLPAILVSHSGSFRGKKASERNKDEGSKIVIYQYVLHKLREHMSKHDNIKYIFNVYSEVEF